MKVSASKPVHTVQVRELVEFVLRRGDLGGERQFVGSDRAMAGIRGHQKIQRSRPAGYETEIPVEHSVDAGEFILRIRGRIDGLLVSSEKVLLEEIKTVQGNWDRTADPLHWAQARIYGFIHAREHGLKGIALRLTYLEMETGKVTEFCQTFTFAELSKFFTTTTAIYTDWLREHHQWCRVRNESIRALAFTFPVYRPGQRELAVAAYRVLANGGRLFLAAPTGIGKTISVLFPAIKALGEGKLENVFYLTARTVGRTVTEPSDGLGTLSALIFAGRRNAIVAFVSAPDMKTGVVMAIFCFASFPPVMNRNNRMKLPSSPFRLPVMAVSTTVNAG